MIRLFQTHSVRDTVALDGLWHFEADGVRAKMPVPGCWDNHPDFLSYRGKAVYERTVDVPEGNVLLTFYGVSHTADVYWDGTHIAGHYGAYTQFDACVCNVPAGTHCLRVEVDNAYGAHSSLHIPNDYHTYGGIIRPVELQRVPDVYIRRMACLPLLDGETPRLRVRAHIENMSDAPVPATLSLTLQGQPPVEREAIVPPGESVQETILSAPGVRLWSPQDPALYLVRAVLHQNGAPVDDLVERVGFRQVRVAGDQILLNGKPVRICGYNRHEDHPAFGAALPLAAQVQDLLLIRDTNANAVRTSHYPNDPRFLDLCDELGMLVWEEGHARGLDEAQMRHPQFDAQCAAGIEEMIQSHYNHPCIVIWGLLNECASDTEHGSACYRRQIAQIKSLDDSRPVTYASCNFFADRCMDLVDIVSYNIYAGWYNPEDPGTFLDRLAAWTDANGGAGKPYIISEFGAGAIYGFRDPRRAKWSEERQRDILAQNIDAYAANERVRGLFIWQFCDVLVSEEWFASRPKTQNNKGIVDAYRRPKLAYDMVREKYGQLAEP